MHEFQAFILLFLLILTGSLILRGIAYIFASLGRWWTRFRELWEPASPWELERLERARIAHEQDRRRNQIMVRALHTVHRQLPRSHDFRRGAVIANQCKKLPTTVRQSIFIQYRPAMIRHFARCVRRRISSDMLVKQLREHVSALAVDPLEADYIADLALANQRKLAVWLEMALVQMDRSPDFQRAISIAMACESLPAAHRHQLFKSYRPAMIRQYVRAATRGVSRGRLRDQLVRLITALATASFEASYIAREGSRRLPGPQPAPPPPTFDEHLDRIRQQRDYRVRAIRNRVDDEDLREQLIEEVDTDFREQTMELNRAQQDRRHGPGGAP